MSISRKTLLSTRAIAMLLILTIVITAMSLGWNYNALAVPPIPSPHNFYEVINNVNQTAFKSDVRYLSSFSRFTGYPGFFEAANYIASKFKELGLLPYRNNSDYFEWFNITVPVDYGAWIYSPSLKLNLTAYSLYPNLVNPNPYATSNESYDTLVYLGSYIEGSLPSINVTGKFVILDFGSGWSYYYPLILKAKGVIFIPESRNLVIRPEADQKLIFLPVYFPRLFLPSTEESKKLLELAKQSGNEGIKVRISSLMKWEEIKVPNIVGFLPGSDSAYSSQIAVVSAYYDSFSIVPSLSFGATDSLGVAELLQLASFMSTHKPKRPVLFVALAGHYQSLWGAREFVEKHFNELQNFVFFTAIDLSSDSDQIGVYAYGSTYTYTYPVILTQRYTWLASRFFGPYLSEMKMILGSSYGDGFVDGILSSHPVYLSTAPVFEPYSYGFFSPSSVYPTLVSYLYQIGTRFDSDPFTLAMYGGGFTFHTTNAFRLYQRTPYDIYDNINFSNVWPQIYFIHSSLWALLNEPEIKLITSPARFRDDWGYVTLNVNVTTYNMLTSYYDPINFSEHPELRDELLVYVTIGGLQIISKVGNSSTVIIHGLKPFTSGSVEVFAVDSRGRITWTTDIGVWAAPGGKGFSLTTNPYTKLIAIFPCASIFVPLSFQPTDFVRFSVSIVNNAQAHSGAIRQNVISLDTFFMAFVQPNIPSELILSIGSGLPSAVINNASYEYPIGKGFTLNQGDQVIVSSMDILSSMYTLTNSRYRKLKSRFATMPLTEYYATLSSELNNVTKESNSLKVFGSSLLGWASTLQWYWSTMGLVGQVVVSLSVFFLIALIFSFFVERLMFSFGGTKSLVVVLLVLALMNFLLSVFHPAYVVATSWPLTLLSISTMLIALFLVVDIISEAYGSAKELREKSVGKHFLEVSRSGFLSSTVNLAIGNLGKRKFRTTLVTISILTIVFATISLASVTMAPVLLSQKVNATSSYKGIEIRNYPWAPLNKYVYDSLKFYLMDKAYVSARAFLYPPPPPPSVALVEEGASVLTYIPLTKKLVTQVYSILALSVDESNVSKIYKFITSGRWFTKDDVFSVIISQSLANSLSNETGSSISVNSTITLWGIKLKVVGIIDDRFENVTNPDGESIMPLDPTSPITFPSHLHLKNVLIVPISLYREIAFPDCISNIAISTVNESQLKSLVNFLPYVITYPMYVNSGEKNYSEALLSRQWIGVEGAGYLLIPMVISSATILDIMLASVYERKREIMIYNAVGMAPLHVITSFIVEALAYSIPAIFLGYLGGIIATDVLIKVGMYPKNLYPNFSSYSVVLVVVLSIVIVLLSVAYPASLAGRLVIPSLATKWTKLEKGPTTDIWKVGLPLVLNSKDEAKGFLFFMKEFLLSSAGRYGSFYIEEANLSEKQVDDTYTIALVASSRFAPYDMGIKSDIIIEAIKQRLSSQYSFSITLRRVSGYSQAWKTTAVLVMDELRKQIIVWRSLSPEDRIKYSQGT
ncbi:MAG: FtsX-like permease family protein [Thermoproteota archaeon]